MVQILPPETSLSSLLGQALGQGLQQGIGGALQNHMKQKQMELQNRLQQDQMRLQNQLGREASREDVELRNKLGTESALQKSLFEHQLAKQQNDIMKQKLLDVGIPEDIAALYSGAPQGGKTAILNGILDLEQRGLIPGGLFSKLQKTQGEQGQEADGNGAQNAQQKTPISQEKERFQFPKITPEKGLKPNEI